MLKSRLKRDFLCYTWQKNRRFYNAHMTYNKLWQKKYFNPLSSWLGLIGDAVKWTAQWVGRTIVDFNNAVARTIWFKNGNALSLTGLALAGWLYFGAGVLSGPIASTTGATQAAVAHTLENTWTGLAIATWSDLFVHSLAQKVAWKDYRR